MQTRSSSSPSPPREIELVHPSYQPSKAKSRGEELIEFPEDTKPDDLARALIQPARMRYVDPKRRR